MSSRVLSVGFSMLLAVFLFAVSTVDADDAAPQNPESKAIDESIAGYTAAYNEADIKSLAAFWAVESDFVDHRGRRYSGRDEIAAMFRQALVEGTGYKIKLAVTARKFLRADLAIDDGVLELTEPSGEVESGRYVTVWTKIDGKWVIQSARDMPSDPATKAAGQNPLNELQFLVGRWAQADDDGSISISCDWKFPGKFLTQEFRVKNKDGDFIVTVWIGWDPIDRKVRSWYFDSHGGFGGATWQQLNGAWKASALGVLADGRTTMSNFEWSHSDKDTIVWKLVNAEVDGEPLPQSELKYTRLK